MNVRTPKELIDLYWFEVWNNGDVELIREICGETMIRHYPGKIIRMTTDQQIARVRKSVENMKPRFTHEVLVCDDTYASSIWNMYSDSFKPMCGIETFKAENGRLTECWNPGYGQGLWDGEEQPWDGRL
jgi:hypothetical protein